MLRPISHDHRAAILQAFRVTTVASPSSSTAVHGNSDCTSVTRNSAGNSTLVHREPGLFKRGPIIVGVASSLVPAGGFVGYDTLPTATGHNIKTLDAAGAAVDGSSEHILWGWAAAQTDIVKNQFCKATFPRPVLQAWRVTNNGTVAVASGGKQGTVVRASAGVVTIVFNPAVTKIFGLAAVPISTSPRRISCHTTSGAGLTVATFDTAGTPTDCDFYLIAAVSKAYFEYGRSRSNLDGRQKEVRVVAGRIAVSAGTPTVSIGGTANGVDVTVTDVGVGEYALTFSKAWKRVPIVVALGKDIPVQAKAAFSITGGNILAFNAAGAAADDSFDFLALGYDSSTEN